MFIIRRKSCQPIVIFLKDDDDCYPLNYLNPKFISVYVLSHFIHVWLFETPRVVACQAPLSMEFSRQ